MARKKDNRQNKKNHKSSTSSKNKVEKVEKKIEEQKQEEEEEEVDYGATADEFFGVANDNDNDNDNDNQEDREDEEEEEEEEEESGSSDSVSKDEPNKEGQDNQKENDSSDDDDDKKEEVKEDNEDEEEEEDDDEDDQQIRNLSAIPPVHTNAGEEPCSFDLRNLTAVNSHPHQETALYKKKKPNTNEKLTINSLPQDQVLNEDYLLQKATEGCTQLIHALWQLPTEKSDAGPLMTLPTYDILDIPRALPPPPPKLDTKWEKFAKERGIAVNKEKRSRKVWDEATQSWKFRHGYDKANASGDDNKWPIMEVGGNDDPYADPWEKARDAKHDRTEHNRERYMKNQERAGILPKGTTRRVLKSREQTRQVGKAGGRMRMDGNASVVAPPPVGVPVDMIGKVMRGQSSTLAALKATQVSTASLGKFDKLREGEPERKFPLASKKKRKLLMTDAISSSGSGNNKKSKGGTGGEQERGLKVLQTVLQGGGVEKEKARKKGKLAKGLTAYDYEYDDGADNALFKKKKGRGGVGKNRKMTKKRIK